MEVILRDLVAEIDPFNDLPLTLKYYRSDPLAVSMVFTQGHEEIPWQVSRDLLTRGLEGQVGDGDVVLWPVPKQKLAIVLVGEDGHSAYLTVDADMVQEFLGQTEDLVPMGAEAAIVMMELDEWLESMR